MGDETSSEKDLYEKWRKRELEARERERETEAEAESAEEEEEVEEVGESDGMEEK